MDTESPEGLPSSFLLEAWAEHEKIAMHFNELILRVRTQALGALAAVVTVGGILLRAFSPAHHIPWGLITSVMAVLLGLWAAIWVLDFGYYNRLLTGAVDSLLALEDAINTGTKVQFNMSHTIEDSVYGRPRTHRREGTIWGPCLFYVIVSAVLVFGVAYSGAKFVGWLP
jgi:hypothetical protein